MGWSRVGETQEQGNRGPEGGAQRRCHGDGEHGKGQAGASWSGGRRPSDAWGLRGGAGEELERRWAALTAGGRGKQRSRGAPEEDEGRGWGSEGLVCKNGKSKDLSVK
jgi:hypothetical protein